MRSDASIKPLPAFAVPFVPGPRKRLAVLLAVLALASASGAAFGAYRPVPPRTPRQGEIPVSAPGNCDRAGATYVLIRDIVSPSTLQRLVA